MSHFISLFLLRIFVFARPPDDKPSYRAITRLAGSTLSLLLRGFYDVIESAYYRQIGVANLLLKHGEDFFSFLELSLALATRHATPS